MKMILTAFLFVVAFSYTVPVHAQSDQEVAAANFLKFLGSNKQILSAETIEANELAPQQPKVVTGSLFLLTGGGYILVSASTSLTPVKAYSLNRAFEALPEPYRKFLLRELEYNVRTLGAAKSLQPAALSENQRRWDFLLRFGESKSPYSYTPDTALLTTKWNQEYPYNRFLPEINGTKVLSGCVNVAVGQVLKYYNYPARGKGVESYTWNGQQLKTILYRDYNWENMPNLLDSATPAYKADEVALLIKDLGIVNHTAFSLTDSGASINTNGLIENFGFSNAIQQMNNTDAVQFFNTLGDEIRALRPVLLSFPGHMTVADGYASDGAGRKIHINMGWGGTADDYYYLDQPVNTGVYIFQPNLYIFYNVKPCSGGDCAPNLETGDTINGPAISGRFNYTADSDRYQVYLKGLTTISGSRGYSNQAFFLTLYDSSSMALVQATDAALSTNLTVGLYTLKISLCGSGVCYPWANDGYANYTVNINTQSLTAQERTDADSGLNVGPVIYNSFTDLTLNSTAPQPYKILIDARDENGDIVTLAATNTNSSAVVVDVSKNIMSITPVAGASKVSSKITVTASSNGKTAEKYFIVMLLNEDISFGKEFVVSGVFENQFDLNSHKVILDGACTITGYNGYSNQAFFTSVKDSGDSTIVAPQDLSINRAFSRNIYSIKASLENGSGTYYAYAAGHETYALTVSCPSANGNTTAIAQMIGVDLTGALGGSILALNAGWNFISTLTSPGDMSIGTVLSDVSPNVRAVWGYDNQNKQWLKYVPNLQNPTLTTFEPGKGYWIYMDSSANVTLVGSDASPSMHLYPGWNLVGYNGTDNRDVASSLMSISGKWNVLWMWDNGWYGKHEIISSLPVPALTLMHRGRAYWIKAREVVNWSQ